MQFAVLAHPSQVEVFVTQDCIAVEYLIKLSQFEEDDLVKVLLFDLPVLHHRTCKIVPFDRWNKDGGRIVVWVTRRALLSILDVFLLHEVWQHLLPRLLQGLILSGDEACEGRRLSTCFLLCSQLHSVFLLQFLESLISLTCRRSILRWSRATNSLLLSTLLLHGEPIIVDLS